MFEFLRHHAYGDPLRARRANEVAPRGSDGEEKLLPDRPTLDGYFVYELPESLAELLLHASQRRPI